MDKMKDIRESNNDSLYIAHMKDNQIQKTIELYPIAFTDIILFHCLICFQMNISSKTLVPNVLVL